MRVSHAVFLHPGRRAAWAAAVLMAAAMALFLLPGVAEANACADYLFSFHTCEQAHHNAWFPVGGLGTLILAILLGRDLAGRLPETEEKTDAQEEAEPPKIFADVAKRVGVDKKLLEAVAAVSSGMDQQKTGPAGGVGIMQLTPANARALGVDPHDMAQNVLGGAKYLKMLLDRFNGNLDLALAAYDAGPGAVERYGQVPPFRETRQFVDAVKRRLEGQP